MIHPNQQASNHGLWGCCKIFDIFRTAVNVLAVLALAGFCCQAPVLAVDAEDGSCMVEALGRAAMDVDAATARDRAIIDARLKAVEQCGGVAIDESSLVMMGIAEEQMVSIKAFAFVKAYEVIKEWEERGIYNAKVKAWVKKGAEKEAAGKDILSNRVVLVMAEGEGSDLIGDALSERLSDAGYFLLDRDFIQSRVSPATWSCLKRGDVKCVDKEFMPFLANYLIKVTTRVRPTGKSYGINTYMANADIKCTQISTARLEPVAKKRNSIFGTDKDQALYGMGPSNFGKKVVASLVSDFMEKMSKTFSSNVRKMRIRIDGVSNDAEYKDFKETLGRLRWVKNVMDDKFEASTGWLSVEYEEKSIYLASAIAYQPRFSVTGYTWDSITVKYIK